MLFCVFVYERVFGRGLKLKFAEVAVANSWSLDVMHHYSRAVRSGRWTETFVRSWLA